MAPPPPLRLQQARVILAAMSAGVLLFVGIVVYLRLTGAMPELATGQRPLVLALVFLTLAEIPAYLQVRRILLARVRAERATALETIDAGRVPPTQQLLRLVGAAMAEAIGLFGTVILMLGGPWALLAAPATALALILAQMPTQERLRREVRAG